MKMTARPINFKFNEYLNKGYELLKKDFGNFVLAFIFCMVLSIIPFCGIMAVGNFYKYCRKVNKGEQANPSDIFNFDDFAAYIIFQLIIIGIVFSIYIPMFFVFPFMGHGEEPSPVLGVFFIFYIFLIIIVIIFLSLKAFYIPALISLGGVKDIKTAWNMSKIMTKDNLLSILLFSIVISFLSQIGILLCGIGILITMPYFYTTHYFAFEDAMQQIEYDEIKEIGQKNEY
ncbi:DUF4013 domain-containing protein [Chryseobacterium daecheongense]|uniref:DUF4013 domain-containing protein n=2 Tax=Chryseobacterium daecheongense TaxID=192389 RepID=A0A3N0VWD0_9FLAO|nr:DUF4013 domain-containing protein [Chryseobacterium daecheongense]ROH96198.1 DUF4013 domain-containing protein [Chryseobacterium daecheongense]UOU99487.1 DUF4013 domain-containing protein [Chryseobacterium daecheongense]